MIVNEAIEFLRNEIPIDVQNPLLPLNKIVDSFKLSIQALEEMEARDDPKPLTIDELKQMDGEPVWLVTNKGAATWAFVVITHNEFIGFNCADEIEREFEIYGDNEGVEFAAYHYKPKQSEVA